MQYDFFKFYNIYSTLYNEAMFNDVEENVNAQEIIENGKQSKASQRLIVKEIGKNMMDHFRKMEGEKKKLNKDYPVEIYAYREFMNNYGKLLPEMLCYELKRLGQNVSLREDARLSFADFDRMVRSYMVNIKNNNKPYVLANSMGKLMTSKGSSYFSADDSYKAEAYLTAFETACQKLYEEMVNFVLVDYVGGNKSNVRNARNEHLDGCLIG